MPALRLRYLLLLFSFIGLTLGSCKKEDDAQPRTIDPQYLTRNSWQLDAIEHDGRTTSSGATIKDRHTLTFRPDGTYSQKMLDDNTTYDGTWMLMTNNTELHFIDHKGDDHQYTLARLSASELRYNWLGRGNIVEEHVFSVIP